MKTIAIIGAGNLGISIADGLLASGFTQPEHLILTRRNTAGIQHYANSGVRVTSDNATAIQSADVVIICLKPFMVKDFLTEFGSVFNAAQIVISTVTGISVQEFADLLPAGIQVFRSMPNTAIAVRESMTCVAKSSASAEAIAYVTELFQQVGEIVYIDEKLMNAATILAACGTAFAMRYIRACTQGGIEIGFDAVTAQHIAVQTVKGATKLLIDRNSHPEHEIDKVTTPRGCTIAGLNEMEHGGFSSSLIKGIIAGYERIA